MQLPSWPEKPKALASSHCESALEVDLGRNVARLPKPGCPVQNVLRSVGLKSKKGRSTAWQWPTPGSALVVEVSPFPAPLHKMFTHGLQHPSWWLERVPGEALHTCWQPALFHCQHKSWAAGPLQPKERCLSLLCYLQPHVTKRALLRLFE